MLRRPTSITPVSHTRTEQDGVHEVVRTYMQIKRKGGSTLRANQNLARLKTTRDITLGTRQNFRQLTHAPFTRCHYAQLQLGESNSLWMPENLRREVGGRPTALGRGCVKTHRAEGHVGSWPLRSTQDRRSELREGFEHPRKQVHHEFSHSLGHKRTLGGHAKISLSAYVNGVIWLQEKSSLSVWSSRHPSQPMLRFGQRHRYWTGTYFSSDQKSRSFFTTTTKRTKASRASMTARRSRRKSVVNTGVAKLNRLWRRERP